MASTIASQIVDRTVLKDQLLAKDLFSDKMPEGSFFWIPGDLYNKLYKASGVRNGTSVVELIRTVLEVVADSPSRRDYVGLADYKEELVAKLQRTGQ
jgi:hypothetical protein